MIEPRWYQTQAHNAAIAFIKKTVAPCLIEAATGSGKSIIVAMLARTLYRISKGKHVLCLVPNSDLVTQNREKYLLTGEPASVYSASAGGKCLKHPVVFGTPGTVKSAIHRLAHQLCAVVLDEAHLLTPTVKWIIEEAQKINPKLRVIGLSATPYRLGEGYIYKLDVNGKPNSEESARDPYFTQLVYKIGAHQLIEEGFLTRPVIGAIGAQSYDTSGMVLNSRNQWNASDVDRAFVGHGRKTAAIVADVVAQSRNRKGVMLFAATVQHAQEIMASLPPGLSRMIGGDINTGKEDRKRLVADYKARRFKYLVSVGTMTTGVDFTHVDVIAILRKTESVSLLQQIIGRGLRIEEGKEDLLVLDYAENLETHCPDGDLFNPEIKAHMSNGGGGTITCACPDCGTENSFSARKNEEEFQVDEFGYFIDLAGEQIQTESGPMPAHYGRRCQALHRVSGEYHQCGYRWTEKKCGNCGEGNDIAARYCSSCKAELVDPNEKLKIEFKQLKRDPTRLQTDLVLEWECRPVVARSGKECIRADYKTPYRQFSIWYHPYATSGKRYAEYKQFVEATDNGTTMPKTITYRKDPDSGFFTAHNYGAPHDEI